MSVPTPKRRIRTLLAATALTAVLATGCTAGDWHYESPPAAGTQADSGPVKARNFVLVTDGSQAVLLGTISSFEAVTLQGAVVTPEDENGGRGQSTALAVTADIPRDGALKLDASNALVEDAALVPGRLAEVTLQFDGGTNLTLDVPVFSTEHEDFADALQA
ncbi:hypothetical protein FOJ82_04555 [Tessaracoccus rhinocerotis]|uniref:Copper chaperone PCu(A)C n=1 Tax=Tessaracoccus rhinocerotis TaxID=1689449 RepID=A0A553K603_9ACTN|nr:hypothetical protein [Tessaracoccus rhinocerotis]TRY20139.1 hypothetical protein FOJ82_04555 [Tessaracoccus rhinocerotis]